MKSKILSLVKRLTRLGVILLPLVVAIVVYALLFSVLLHRPSATLTAIVTLFGGILLFVAQSILKQVLFAPALKLRKLRGESESLLHFWANLWSSPVPLTLGENFDPLRQRANTASDELRRHATTMLGTITSVVGYKYLYWLRIIPASEEDFRAAVGCFIAISNGIVTGTNDRAIEVGEQNLKLAAKICRHLKLPKKWEV